MLTYRVDDMTCGHCATVIAKAVRALDAGAEVRIDPARRLVAVVPTEADADQLAGAIAEAGYTPVPVESAVAAQPPAKKGGCCGCCR